MPLYNVQATLDNIADGVTYLRVAGVNASHKATDASIADNAIVEAMIHDGEVTTTKILDEAVTFDKLEPDLQTLANLAAQTVYAAGTAYQLTNTAAALVFGTTSPTFAFAQAGTYSVRARVRLDYNAATFAAVRTVTLKLRVTSGTPADVADSSCAVKTQIVTTLTGTFIVVELPEVIATFAALDELTIFASVNTVPSAGSLDAVEASIVAQQIA